MINFGAYYVLFLNPFCYLLRQRISCGAIGGYPLSIFIYQEFMEIPANFCIFHAIFAFFGKPFIERSNVFPFNRDFCHHWEGNSVVQCAEFFDFLITAWLLAQEIIGRKAYYYKIVFSIFFIQLFKLGILRSEATFGCYVNYQYFLSLKGGK